MQNNKKDTKSSGPFSYGVRTRYQLLKNKEVNNMKIEVENKTIIKHDHANKDNKKATKMEAVCVAEKSPQRSFPDFEAFKDTISFGRGSTEGASRTAQEVFKSDNAPTTSEPESFAPTNFKFTVPSGVNSFQYSASNFHFKPLSPKSADAFLFPTSASFFESPHNAPALNPLKRDEKIASETDITLENTTSMIPNNSQDIGSAVISEDSVSSSTDYQHKENSYIGDNVNQLENERDSSYFRNLLETETLKLNNLSKKWNEISESETELNEEGKILCISPGPFLF